MRDYYSNLAAALALSPAVQAATVNGAAVDLINASGAVFMLSTGAIVGAGDFAAKVEESEDGVTFTDAAAQYVQSDAPATLAESASYRLGYLGHKRYARLTLTKTGGTSIAAGASVALRPLQRPVA